MIKREIGLTGKNPQQTAPVPTPRRTRVEGQATIDQANCDIYIFAKISEGEGGKRQYVRVVGADP